MSWSEAKLLQMISDGVGESSSLDYKNSAALSKSQDKVTELTKDVSAFANAGGGLIIYGVGEDKTHGSLFLDEGVDPSAISKEWLENVISSRIERKIEGINIHVVALSDQRAGRVAYVVEVPQSTRAPHMADDHRFYKRYNFKSEPMEEYEVRDVALRSQSPQLALYFYPIEASSVRDGILSVALDVHLVNRGREPANTVCAQLDFDARLVLNDERSGGTVVWSEAGEIPRLMPIVRRTIYWGGPTIYPVFDGAPARIAQLRVEALQGFGGGPFVLWWTLSTPRAPPADGASLLHWRDDTALETRTVTLSELADLPNIDWCTTREAASQRGNAVRLARHPETR